MTDERIHQLLCRAHELDQFEADLLNDHAAPLRLVPAATVNASSRVMSSAPIRNSDRTFRRIVYAGLGFASIAAAVALSFVTLQTTRTEPDVLKPAALAREFPPYIVEFLRAIEAAGQRTERDVMLAVYEPANAPGKSDQPETCMQMWTPLWSADRDVSDAQVADLLSESLDHTCMDRPGRVTIVGLTGPDSELPQTQAQALDLVACMMDARSHPAHDCGMEEWSLNSAASQCLPNNVSVRVQTISLNR